MTLTNFFEQTVVVNLAIIESKAIEMMNEEDHKKRVDLKFDIQNEIETILKTLGG